MCMDGLDYLITSFATLTHTLIHPHASHHDSLNTARIY